VHLPVDRQNLAGDPVAVALGRLHDEAGGLGIAPEAHADPVGDGQPAGPAVVVDRPGQLPGQALEAQVVVDLEVEGHGEGPVLREGKLLVLLGPDLEVARVENDGLAVDHDGVAAGLLQRAAGGPSCGPRPGPPGRGRRAGGPGPSPPRGRRRRGPGRPPASPGGGPTLPAGRGSRGSRRPRRGRTAPAASPPSTAPRRGWRTPGDPRPSRSGAATGAHTSWTGRRRTTPASGR